MRLLVGTVISVRSGVMQGAEWRISELEQLV
jgi:hypothetical protein